MLVWIADLGLAAAVWITGYSSHTLQLSLLSLLYPLATQISCPLDLTPISCAPWTSIHQRNHTAHTRTRGGRLELKSIKLQYIGRLIEPAGLHGRNTKTVQILIKSLSCVRVAAWWWRPDAWPRAADHSYTENIDFHESFLFCFDQMKPNHILPTYQHNIHCLASFRLGKYLLFILYFERACGRKLMPSS